MRLRDWFFLMYVAATVFYAKYIIVRYEINKEALDGLGRYASGVHIELTERISKLENRGTDDMQNVEIQQLQGFASNYEQRLEQIEQRQRACQP